LLMVFAFVGSAWAEDLPPLGPMVKKIANTFYKLTHSWEITKSAPVTELTLSPGQTYLVPYTIQLTHSGVESDWAVSGYADVYNRLSEPITLNSLSDEITPGAIGVDLRCHWGENPTEIVPPVVIPANHVLVCDYSRSLPDGQNRMNTAIANITLPSGASQDISGNAAVDFSTAEVDHVDECVAVVDSYGGTLGTVCGQGETFQYTRSIRYDVCGQYVVQNTAAFTAEDSGATDSSSWDINVYVPCGGGCTLTPGYWKTHSTFGPAPYDDTWASIGESAPFFSSGLTYYEILWTPTRGNAYYILARAYIAAELNQLNGASLDGGAGAAFGDATALFSLYTPGEIEGLKKNDTLRAEFISLATILDNYNNGLLGPGHCSE
jgi:hypothetical protein